MDPTWSAELLSLKARGGKYGVTARLNENGLAREFLVRLLNEYSMLL